MKKIMPFRTNLHEELLADSKPAESLSAIDGEERRRFTLSRATLHRLLLLLNFIFGKRQSHYEH